MKLSIALIVGCLLWGGPMTSDALTANEILLLKQHGISEKTIQMMLESEMQARSQIGAAADEPMGVRTITRPGGRPAIVYSTGRDDRDLSNESARRREEQAWEMLRHLIVDTRSTDN